MPNDPSRAWRALALISAYNEAVVAIPGAPLDVQTWIGRHLRVCPIEFVFDDWSGYRPAFRKIRLVKAGERV